MPHRVANFLRTSTHNLETQLAAGFKRQKSPPQTPRHSRSASPSYASSINEEAEESGVMIPERHESSSEGHHHHRLSLNGLGQLIRGTKDLHIHQHSNQAATLNLKVESPPLVLYGDASTSTGALFSGSMHMELKEDVPVESFTGTLRIHVTQKRPFTAHCHDCTHQYTELQSWSFLKAPLVLTKGSHYFPFSFLLGGHLPATMDGPLVNIAYEFHAEATPGQGHGPSIKFDKNIEVKRSQPEADIPHHSIRVFPPIDVKSSAHYPQVIHPLGVNTLSLRLDGIAKSNPTCGTVEFWKLKKLSWKLEEKSKVIAPACEKHAPKDEATSEDASPAKKGLERTDSRIIGEQTYFKGWKSNYSSADDATVEMEFDWGLSKKLESELAKSKKHKRYVCDTKCADGTEVTHQLEIEMVVSQEYAPAKKLDMVTQTGVGRIMRMHFNVILTEPSGLGISWDNEAPPIYSMVPASPPAYCGSEGSADELDLSNIETLLGGSSPTSPIARSPPSSYAEASGSV
ncbi:hypothetical protein PspLS_02309 [Pyricularia sp. CBS 133598]|nr:hypothetical protein PspLS_02309 [Pyricularia sp. CBS 133598]